MRFAQTDLWRTRNAACPAAPSKETELLLVGCIHEGISGPLVRIIFRAVTAKYSLDQLQPVMAQDMIGKSFTFQVVVLQLVNVDLHGLRRPV